MNLLRKGMFVLLGLGITVACSDDDDAPITDPGNGGGGSAITNVDFALEASADTRTGTVTPSSDGGTLYTVDFGDASTEDDVFQTSGPAVSYTYPATTATYTISVTASASGADDVTVTKDHTVTIPDVQDPSPLVGTWSVAPIAGALGVGPEQGDVSWWASSEEDITTRACFFDDTYVFGADGSFTHNMGDATWLEGWQGAEVDGCGSPVYPQDGSDNTYTYSYDESAQTVTLNGVGAHVGISKVYNDGEFTSPSEINGVESITYEITELSEDGNTVTLDISIGGGYWRFILQKSGTDNGGGNNGGGSDSPLVGSWSVAPEAAALGVGPEQGDVSWWASSEEDVTTRACFFDDTYVFGADGSFTHNMGDATWLEGWQGAEVDGCGSPVYPQDGSDDTYTYSYDESAQTITLNGVGAHVGISKVYNDGEFTSPSEINGVESITYEITEMSENNDKITLDISIGGGYWRFILVKN